MTFAKICVLSALGLTACAEQGLATFGDNLADLQVPPRGSADMPAWLEAGYYKSWHCEAESHAPRAQSPHGANRVCANDALHGAPASGQFPVGAAAVKEIYNDAGIKLYAVSRKVEPTTGGDSWYWYEGLGGSTKVNSEGASQCIGCHAQAAPDFVFTRP